MRNRFKLLLALTAGVVASAMLAQQAQATPITLNFGNTQGGQINFDGAGGFNFSPGGAASAANNSFKITGASGPSLSIGDFGTMSGSWTFDGAGNVSGSGTLDIEDFAGSHLTATLTWGKLTLNANHSGGFLNEALTVNLSGVTYLGADPDLSAFLGGGKETVSFTFPTGGHTLTDLATVAQSTSFSGSLTPLSTPDGGVTAGLLGFALLGIETLRRRLAK